MKDKTDKQKIFEADLSNIVRKVKAGKPLSKSERAVIDASLNEEPEWVSSDAKLSQIFGPHRASFPRFRKTHPDAPAPRDNGEHQVSAWREFFDRHPELLDKVESEKAVASIALKEKILREKLRDLKRANDVQENLYLRKADVDAWIAATCQRIKDVLQKKLRNELPPKLEGLRAPEMAAKMDAVILDICRLLQSAPGPEE